jgi:hypothetical protein
MDPLSAILGIGSTFASLFGGGQPPTVLQPQQAQGVAPVDLASIPNFTPSSGVVPQPSTDLFQPVAPPQIMSQMDSLPFQAPNPYAPGAEDVNDVFQGLQMQQPAQMPQGGGLAGFFAEGRVPQGPDQSSDLLNAARQAPPQAPQQPPAQQAPKAAKVAPQQQRNVAQQVAAAAPAASKVAESMTKAPAAAVDAAAKGSEKFLGLSGGQWQGIGAATGILAQLFKSEPKQVLQIQQRSQQGPPPVQLSSVPMIQSRN